MMSLVLVVTRHRVPVADAVGFLERARAAVAALAERPGWRSGRVARAVDDPELWAVATEWDGVGAYRRALSSYDVKLAAVPLLATAVDEPTAFEVLDASGLGAAGLAVTASALAADSRQVRLGEAAAPEVATDLDHSPRAAQ